MTRPGGSESGSESESESESDSFRHSRVSRWESTAYLASMILIGSSTAAAAKFAVRELPVGFIPLVRFGGAGLALLPFVLRDPRFRALVREAPGRLALIAALCVPINQTFFLNGARFAPIPHISLIYASCPLIVLVLATLLGQERLRPSRILGVTSSVAGLLVIALGNLWSADASGTHVLFGDLLLVMAVLSWSGYLTMSKPLVGRYGSLAVLAGTFLFGGLFDLPIALATFPWSESPFDHVSWKAWAGLAHLVLIVTLVGLYFQNKALHLLDASQVATFGNLAPLLAIVWGYFIFGDRLTWASGLGGALILAGALGVGPRAAGEHASRIRKRSPSIVGLSPAVEAGAD